MSKPNQRKASPGSRSLVKVNKGFKLPAAAFARYLPTSRQAVPVLAKEAGGDMAMSWRISSFNGALLAAYFIPTWTIVALRIMTSPIHGLYERPNIAVGLFISDHLQLAAMGTARAAWLLAVGRLTVVAFFASFLALLCRRQLRSSGGSDEALSIALGIGSIMSFAGLLMAYHVGETAALRLHATELLLLLGTAIVFLVEQPEQSSAAGDGVSAPASPPKPAARSLSPQSPSPGRPR